MFVVVVVVVVVVVFVVVVVVAVVVRCWVHQVFKSLPSRNRISAIAFQEASCVGKDEAGPSPRVTDIHKLTISDKTDRDMR